MEFQLCDICNYWLLMFKIRVTMEIFQGWNRGVQMKKQYFIYKLIKFFIILLMSIIFGILLLIIYEKMTSQYSAYSSFPSTLYLVYLVLYIPILLAGIFCLRRINKKLKKLFPEKYPPHGPMTKKNCSGLLWKLPEYLL